MLLVALVWGTSYGVAKGALDFYPVLGFLAVHFDLTFFLLLPALLRAPNGQQRDALRTGLPLGGLMLCIFVCETFGVAQTLASHAALLISLCVVLTPLAQWWLPGQRPGPAIGVFSAVSLLGALLLGGGLSARLNWGDALMLIAAALRAITVCKTSQLARNSRALDHAAAHILNAMATTNRHLGHVTPCRSLVNSGWSITPRSTCTSSLKGTI